MLRCKISPRFCETDALGHINNTILPVWFETAREPIFEMCNPGKDLANWNLILRKIDVDFLAQTYYEYPVEVRSRVAHVGNSSFTVEHQLWQREQLTATGTAVLVFFDYSAQEKRELPPEIRQQLQNLG
jgi:acyl-CoA thioester hydrolase